MKRDDESARHPNLVTRDSATETIRQTSQVLVVGKSPINRVVISKIVERSGLKPISESPDMAAKTLRLLALAVIVLDGGADNRDCDTLMPGIEMLRRASGKSLPPVVLLSTKNGTPESLGLSNVVDAVVAKPITPERLQPVIDRLVNR
ncbi:MULTISPECIES: response regulator [unclassified Mesorhizobium]|uniref:response regulator n=1 Tax=unclassified Mesorhizobium TaxID=325217 RepID=UPI00112652A3|nr:MULTISPECIES: response regulator [unclassified Mesorhizobium]TPI50580.1 response regulator [Mesorhizobium sp. B3-1-1]TPJ64851.1 response regulator [Mesorhizobium sp. B2-6-7]TPJ80751.1 response regulator [Mesorhizobium sp. B2-6-3]TPK02039.1 response regulator [Mesorhizobium sp. B2-5-10]TPK05295.1 response regulator [Mesorhizobium sp. B2-5-11]